MEQDLVQEEQEIKEEPKKKKKDKKNKHEEELAIALQEANDKALRAMAELQNYRKRKDEEVSAMLKYANADLLKDLLPVLDNFERAVNMDDENLDDEVSKFLKGFEIIYTEMKELFKKYGVKEVEALGKKLDPNCMEAVFVVEDKQSEPDTVLEVLQKGYYYHDRLLRASMVKVSK